MISTGLWRRAFGAPIVESSYDFEKKTIGIYTLPEEAHCQQIADVGNSALPLSVYYAFMQKYNDALAVWGINNEEIVVFTDSGLLFILSPTVDGNYKEIYKQFFNSVLQFPKYRHVGYIKTFQRCVSVYQWPWYLYIDANNIAIDMGGVVRDAIESPPLSLYKSLITTDYDAVYQRSDGSIQFLKKER